MSFIYGLYQIPHDQVSNAIYMAYDLGIRNFDSAQLYGNERICAGVLSSLEQSNSMTTKIFHASTTQQLLRRIKHSRKIVEKNKIKCNIILHRWMEPTMYHTLVDNCESFEQIGVSNYDLPKLQELLSYCEQHDLRKPDMLQIEVHPFVDCIPLINFCHQNNIRVEGHTILARGKYFNYDKTVELAKQYNCTAAQIMTSWALSKNIDVCVKSLDNNRLKELLDTPRDIDTSILDTEYQNHTHRFYKIHEHIYDFDGIAQQLEDDLVAEIPSNLCEKLELSGYDYIVKGGQIAAKLFPATSEQSQLNLYRKLIKNLRTKRINSLYAEKKKYRNKKKGITCSLRNEKGYTRSMTHPSPMPVDETNPSEFIPFYDYIVNVNPSTINESSTFIKGTMFGDGRMDLCKQVVGPSSIESLCENVGKSMIIKHFLLGNNIAFQKINKEQKTKTTVDKLAPATAISNLMATKEGIETYYLAGNCIDHEDMQLICEGLANNLTCKALWLKRNPIGPIGAIYLNKLLSINKTLNILDLHNCALGDDGLANLFANPENITALKHVYLDANMIENLDPLIAWIKSGANLVSLYLSINRLGDTQVKNLCASLQGSTNLKRLCLASTHITNESMPNIADMCLSCPNLICLNLGCYKSTMDMGELPGNLFNDDSYEHIVRILGHPKLQYYSSLGCQMSHEKLEQLKSVSDKVSIETGSGTPKFVHVKNELQVIKHPEEVRDIASIYRGKM